MGETEFILHEYLDYDQKTKSIQPKAVAEKQDKAIERRVTIQVQINNFKIELRVRGFGSKIRD